MEHKPNGPRRCLMSGLVWGAMMVVMLLPKCSGVSVAERRDNGWGVGEKRG